MAIREILFVAFLVLFHLEYGQAVCRMIILKDKQFTSGEDLEYKPNFSYEECELFCILIDTCQFARHIVEDCWLSYNPSPTLLDETGSFILKKDCGCRNTK
ncbi:unnamed protein product [Lymnaea stagnalis]|uniref:Apple domain-containing protein n=1 Tax=Lymnaea stagnalis TaxID=6523 RepID=A0AAV2IJ40_LYMST